MLHAMGKQKVVVVGAGPVGALAAIYAARRGDDVELYELRDGRHLLPAIHFLLCHSTWLGFSFQFPSYFQLIYLDRSQ